MNNTKRQPYNRINSNQNTNGSLLIGCGLLLLLAGSVCAYLVLKKVIPGESNAALFVLLLPIAGLALTLYGLKTAWAYHKFGATPLVLDPAVPGVGGQLAGTIQLSTADVNASKVTDFRAVLTCTHRRLYGKERKDKVRWQEEAPIHWQYNPNNAEASFVFEIPEHCWPSREWSENSSVDWSLRVEGTFESLGKFERSWDVVIEKLSANASTAERAKAA